MPSLTETADMWDHVLGEWSVGARKIPEHLIAWSHSY